MTIQSEPILISQAQIRGYKLFLAQVKTLINLFDQYAAQHSRHKTSEFSHGKEDAYSIAANSLRKIISEYALDFSAISKPLNKVAGDHVATLLYLKRNAPGAWCDEFERRLRQALDAAGMFPAWCSECAEEIEHVTGTQGDVCTKCGYVHDPQPF